VLIHLRLMKMQTKDESCSNVRYGTTLSLLTCLGLRSFCSIRRSDGVYVGGIIFSDRRLSKNTYARGLEFWKILPMLYWQGVDLHIQAERAFNASLGPVYYTSLGLAKN
jgi:hypothetical protein